MGSCLCTFRNNELTNDKLKSMTNNPDVIINLWMKYSKKIDLTREEEEFYKYLVNRSRTLSCANIIRK